MAIKKAKKAKKSTKKTGFKCAGKTLATSMIGSHLTIKDRTIKGVGRRKNGTPFDDQAVKAFAQWKWHWQAEVETHLINDEGESKVVYDTYSPSEAMGIFDLEKLLFERQTLIVLSETGYEFVEKNWKATITASPI